jgi:hypothetical protein
VKRPLVWGGVSSLGREGLSIEKGVTHNLRLREAFRQGTWRNNLMIVKTKTNFAGEVVSELTSPTLKKVLIGLSDKVSFPICSPEDENVQGDFKVYLNGVEYENLAGGINTPLNEGDKVEVAMVILAGG